VGTIPDICCDIMSAKRFDISKTFSLSFGRSGDFDCALKYGIKIDYIQFKVYKPIERPLQCYNCQSITQPLSVLKQLNAQDVR